MKIVSSKPTITRKELEGVLDCMISDDLSSGSSVKIFEAGLSSITGFKYPLAVSSLTAAYHLIFNALEIGPGDEVVIPSYFSKHPLAAAKMTGAEVVPVDSDENSLFSSPEAIQSVINDKTKAVIVGHTFGFHYDESSLYELKVPVIEDISHVLGTELNDAHAGRKAAFAVSSFAPSMIITTGKGAAVYTANSKYYSTMRDMRGGSDVLNYDYCMNDLEAAMGISQLIKIRDFLKRRRDIAKIYSEAIKVTSHRPLYPYTETAAYQTYPVIFDSTAEKTEKFWKKSSIEMVNPLPKALHHYLGLRGLDYPNSDRLTKKLYALPVYPTLSKKDIDRVAKTLSSFI